MSVPAHLTHCSDESVMRCAFHCFDLPSLRDGAIVSSNEAWFNREPAKGACVVREWLFGNVGPCDRVQHRGFGRVEAVAVDVGRIGVVDATVIGPVKPTLDSHRE